MKDADVFATVTPLLERPPTFSARVVLGLPAYNGSRFLRQTLESILSQTFTDFALVVHDDSSEDATPDIIREVLADVPNAFAFRGLTRKGMIGAWDAVFRLGRKVVPNQEYFSWCADHDLLDPRWLEAMVEELDNNPQATLAYPLTAPMDEEGRVLKRANQVDRYEARGFPSSYARFHNLHRAGKGFGNMVYGLMRSDAMERAGVFREVLAPDRLVVLEVGLQGEIHVLPEVLRWRRATAKYSKSRQQVILFKPGDAPPFNSHLNTRLVHAIEILKAAGQPGYRPPDLDAGQLLALSYDQVYWEVRKRTVKRFLNWHKQLDSQYKKAYRWFEPVHLAIKRNIFQVAYKKAYAWFEPHYMRFKRSDLGKGKNSRPKPGAPG